MLYKKYHRNYIKQLKKGVKFKFSFYNHEEMVVEVVVEPYYDKAFWRRNICLIDSEHHNLALVSSEGQLIGDIHVV